jgi:hypothetical protein
LPSRITGGIVLLASGSDGRDAVGLGVDSVADALGEGVFLGAADDGDGVTFTFGGPTLVVASGVGLFVAEWSAVAFAAADESHPAVAASAPVTAIAPRIRRLPTILLSTTSSCIGKRATVGRCEISVRLRRSRP